MPMKIAETIIRALTEPVLVLDSSLRVILANPALHETLKIVPGRLEGRSVQELISGENGQPRLAAVFEAVLSHGCDIKGVEVECAIPPRTRNVLAVSTRRLVAGDDSDELILVELQDVTNERATKRRIHAINNALRQHAVNLEDSNSELESFTHSVSHDLRTPLRFTNKIGHLILQEYSAQLPEGAIEKVQMMLNSTEEMDKLIEDLLKFSKVSRESMKRRRVDIRKLAREALRELQHEQQGRRVESTIEALPPCQADRTLLKQVLVNLLANALKFTRTCEQAEIRVGFAHAGGETVYFVRDNGVGFDMNQSDALFQAFHRLHRSHEFEGSGVGLAIVKRIVERHSGRIWAEGERDRGATFYFTLGEKSVD